MEKKVVERLNSVAEVAERLGVKETTVKLLIRTGKLLSVKIGDRRLVPTSAVDAYIENLIREASADRDLTPVA